MSPAEPSVRLRPMTADEFPPFSAATTADYARDMEAHGGFTHEAAVKKASDAMQAVLPTGLETPGHAIFVIEAAGAVAGRLWLAERSMGGRRVLFVYDISIDPAFQGQGHGRAAMTFAEAEAR